MKENSTHVSGSISFAGLLTIVLITLKLTGHIDWSWIWVLSPLWIGLVITLVIIGVGLLAILLMAVYETYVKNRRC